MKKLKIKLKQLFCLHNYQDNKYLTMMGLKGKMCVKCYKGDKINFVMSNKKCIFVCTLT